MLLIWDLKQVKKVVKLLQKELVDIKNNNNSITGRYLSNKSFIPVPRNRKMAKNGRYLEILSASGNNLKNVNLKVPLVHSLVLRVFLEVVKSTLILQTLFNALNLYLNNNKSRKIPLPFKGIKGIELVDKIIDIDQSQSVEPLDQILQHIQVLLVQYEIGLQIFLSLKAEDTNLKIFIQCKGRSM